MQPARAISARDHGGARRPRALGARDGRSHVRVLCDRREAGATSRRVRRMAAADPPRIRRRRHGLREWEKGSARYGSRRGWRQSQSGQRHVASVGRRAADASMAAGCRARVRSTSASIGVPDAHRGQAGPDPARARGAAPGTFSRLIVIIGSLHGCGVVPCPPAFRAAEILDGRRGVHGHRAQCPAVRAGRAGSLRPRRLDKREHVPIVEPCQGRRNRLQRGCSSRLGGESAGGPGGTRLDGRRKWNVEVESGKWRYRAGATFSSPSRAIMSSADVGGLTALSMCATRPSLSM